MSWAALAEELRTWIGNATVALALDYRWEAFVILEDIARLAAERVEGLGEPAGEEVPDAERALSLAVAIQEAALRLQRAESTEEIILGLKAAWRGKIPPPMPA
jgi:hypothetical protein